MTIFPDNLPGRPPVIIGPDMRYYCAHCGKPHVAVSAYRRHLVFSHGWNPEPAGEVRPPDDDGGEDRKAA